MPHLGIGELIIIFMLAILVFGATRLPQIGEGMGKAIKNFKRSLASNDDIQVSSSNKQVSSDAVGPSESHNNRSTDNNRNET